MAELGCLASMPIFSSTMPLACDAPQKGLAYCEMLCALAYSLFAHFWSRRWFLSLRPARRPFGLPLPMVRAALSADFGRASPKAAPEVGEQGVRQGAQHFAVP